MSKSGLIPALMLGMTMLWAEPAAAHNGPHKDAPDSYAVSTDKISFFNTPNRRHSEIKGGEATLLGKVSVNLKKKSNVLVLFTSGVTTVTAEGCPCSVRASIQVDGGEPIVIKRINLSGASTLIGNTYQPDRQSLDGNYVLSLPPGSHEISVIAQRIEGESKTLYAFYQNIQALPFEFFTSTP